MPYVSPFEILVIRFLIKEVDVVRYFCPLEASVLLLGKVPDRGQSGAIKGLVYQPCATKIPHRKCVYTDNLAYATMNKEVTHGHQTAGIINVPADQIILRGLVVGG